jgi:HEAT repeat protein
MTARKRILASLVLLAVFGLLAWEILYSRVPDPIYVGKHLSYWVEHPEAEGAAKRNGAVRSAGTNAIPLLLRFVRAHDSPARKTLIKLVRSQSFLRIHLYSDENRHDQAATGFEALGQKAQSAVPELMRIYNSNLSRNSQLQMLRLFGCIGPGAKEAIPLLIRATTNSDRSFRIQSIGALARISDEPDVIVPLLTKLLGDADSYTRVAAASGLGNFGPQASVAIPQLFELRNSVQPGNVPMMGLIDDAIRKIDPIAAENAGIEVTNTGRAAQ